MFLYFHLLAAPWVHQDQWYLHGTEACRAQGPSKALSFKCANFSSDCYWKVFDGRLLPNTRSEGSNAAGSIRTALAAFWKFTSGVVHLMATRLNLHCWLQDWATHRWGDLGQLEAPGMPQGRPMDHKGLDPTRNWWLAFKEKTKNKEKRTRARERKAEQMELSQMALEDLANQWTAVTLETWRQHFVYKSHCHVLHGATWACLEVFFVWFAIQSLHFVSAKVLRSLGDFFHEMELAADRKKVESLRAGGSWYREMRADWKHIGGWPLERNIGDSCYWAVFWESLYVALERPKNGEIDLRAVGPWTVGLPLSLETCGLICWSLWVVLNIKKDFTYLFSEQTFN